MNLVLFYYFPMNILVSLILSAAVVILGLTFALFPKWGLKVICRCAQTYMMEDLTSDPSYVIGIRFYGIAAVALGLYALYQIIIVW